MNDESTSVGNSESMIALRELVLEHLGLPLPKQSKHVQTLQDELLPRFMTLAKSAWMASSPFSMAGDVSWPTHPIQYVRDAASVCAEDISRLGDVLDEMGVHALFYSVASSTAVKAVSDLPIDDYECRLLREIGHGKPQALVRELLARVAANPELLSNVEPELAKAEEAMQKAHSDTTIVINLATPPVDVPSQTAAKRRSLSRLIGPLGELASGLVLLMGNAIVAPTVAMVSVTALPVFGSLAAGIAAVCSGAEGLLGGDK